MHTSTLSPRRIVRTLTSLTMIGALTACAEPTVPARAVSPNPIIIIGGRPLVFNAVLRAVGNPNEAPRAVEGHLQLKLYEGESGLIVGWKAHLVNPECDGSNTFGGGMYFIQDSEDFPSPEDEADIPMPPPESPLGCSDSLVGSAGISADLASRLIGNPNEFVAAFFLDDGGTLAGRLRLGPDATPTR